MTVGRPDEAGAGAARELGPLPGGHHGLSRKQVAESQRERLLAATAQVAVERGYQAMTITEIVKTASVANRVFYDNFGTKEECFLAAFEAVLGHVEGLLADAVASVDGWPQQVVAAIEAGLRFFDDEPRLARLCLIAPLTATTTIAARYRQAVASAVPFLAGGRRQRPAAESLPESTEDSLLGGLISLTSRSLLAEEEPLRTLLPDLVDFVLSPYLGAEEAQQLATEAAPPVGETPS